MDGLKIIENALLGMISGGIPIHHLKEHVKKPRTSERVYQDLYWGTCWFVAVIDVLLTHSPQTLLDMIDIEGDQLTINWKATPKFGDSSMRWWKTTPERCSVTFKPSRRAIGGNPLMIAGSCGNSTLDLDVTNDNLLVEVIMEGFTKTIERQLYDGEADATEKTHEELDSGRPRLAVSLFVGISSLTSESNWDSSDQLKQVFTLSPMGALFVVSSKSETSKLISGNAYSVQKWDGEKLYLQNPQGIDDCVLDYKEAYVDVHEVIWFVPETVQRKTERSKNEEVVKPSPIAQITSYPRNNYVFQYWDIIFSATLVVYLLFFNCPKYIFGKYFDSDSPAESYQQISTIGRLFVIPLLYIIGLSMSATWDTFYVPGQHILLTIVGLWYSGLSIDSPDRLLGFFPETTHTSIVSMILILLTVFVFVQQLDCVQHIVGYVAYITIALAGTVVCSCVGK
jgi:hypothetical protein